MSGVTLRVNPEVLRSAGTSFGQVVDGLATAAIESARKFGGNLNAAARLYQGQDQDSAAAIEGIDLPK